MWDAASSPSARAPPESPPVACQDKATPRLQRRRSVIQGRPFSWQIRPLERGGGQGCPSAPVFVHQLGLISRVLTLVHWFPLHVPRGFQTPLQNSSAPPPESSCLWTQAIFLPLPHPRIIQTVLPWASSKSRPWLVVLGHTGCCRMPRTATSTHPSFHPLVCSQTVQNLSAELPLPAVSPEQRFSPTSPPPWLAKPHVPQQRFLLV